ncbi:MAG: hypothetical protein WA063_06080, partial [Minisyncoccia bacterium]
MNKLLISIIAIVILAAGIGAFFVFQKSAFPEPKISHYNVFIVHFEPRSADERGFQRFKEWVVFAKEHNQKFSLGFTPQWVEMILKDPVKLSFAQELFKEGWDLNPHHHGAHHGWDWDGYCNYGAERCMKLREKYYRSHPSPIMKWWYKEKERYNGNMSDYMKLMTKLYPFKVMEMGPDKFFDWPPEIQFSTTGKANFFLPSGFPVFDEPVGFPDDITTIPGLTHFEKKTDYYNGKLVYECSMRPILTREALEEAKRDYEFLQRTGRKNEFMATVIHIEDDEALFKDWIKYLHSQDPNGIYNKSITEIVNINEIVNQSLEKSQEKNNIDSPFGMSGAFSRPFVPNDAFPEEKIHQMISQSKELYNNVQDIGVKWIRPGMDIGWSSVQPTKEHIENGLYEWTIFDKLYGEVPSGVNVLATITVGHVNLGLGIKPGTWEFIDKEVEGYYLKFIKELVERYDGDGYKDMPGLKNPIKYWQTQNEPIFINNKEQVMKGDINLDWRGFSRFQEITYKAIKETDPNALVAIGGLATGHAIHSNEPFFARKEREEFYIPLLRNLQGKYIDIFDIHFYGSDTGWPSNWIEMKDIYLLFRQELDQNGYKNTEIWFTEIALPSNPFGEKLQANNLIKRYVYPLSFGVKKIFWWNVIEGEYPLEDDAPSDHFGLIYDGIGKDDPGYGVKKLAYYTYKKMVEVLEGSDWNNIQTIQEKDGIYIYKFTKNGKLIWVAWNDNSQEKQITISGISLSQIKITETVPKYETGKEVTDYN